MLPTPLLFGQNSANIWQSCQFDTKSITIRETSLPLPLQEHISRTYGTAPLREEIDDIIWVFQKIEKLKLAKLIRDAGNVSLRLYVLKVRSSMWSKREFLMKRDTVCGNRRKQKYSVCINDRVSSSSQKNELTCPRWNFLRWLIEHFRRTLSVFLPSTSVNCKYFRKALWIQWTMLVQLEATS